MGHRHHPGKRALLGYDIFIPDTVPRRVRTLKSDFPLPTDEVVVHRMDAWDLRSFLGGCIRNYPAPCLGMPMFVRAEESELLDRLHAALKRIPRGVIEPGRAPPTATGIDRDIPVTG